MGTEITSGGWLLSVATGTVGFIIGSYISIDSTIIAAAIGFIGGIAGTLIGANSTQRMMIELERDKRKHEAKNELLNNLASIASEWNSGMNSEDSEFREFATWDFPLYTGFAKYRQFMTKRQEEELKKHEDKWRKLQQEAAERINKSEERHPSKIFLKGEEHLALLVLMSDEVSKN